MKKKLLIVGAIALFAATATTLFFYSVLSDRVVDPRESEQTAMVLVALRDLPRGTRLTDKDLEAKPIPSAELPPGALREGDEVEGRYLAKPAPAGKPILDSYFPTRETGGISAAIPPGQRAVSLHVEEYAGVTGLVQPGDRVDVLVANGRRNPGDRKLTLSTLVENVEVLDTGRSADERNPPPVVTVLVDAREVEKISLADQSGAVRLALRNPTDTDLEIVGDKKPETASSGATEPESDSSGSKLASASRN